MIRGPLARKASEARKVSQARKVLLARKATADQEVCKE